MSLKGSSVDWTQLKEESVNQKIYPQKSSILKQREHTTYQNVWDAAKTVLGGKFIALSAQIRKERPKSISGASTFRNQKNKSKLAPNKK